MDLYKLTQEVEPYVIAMRREFHANPEISFHEVRTTARIREELDKLGIPHETVGSGNVVGLLDTRARARPYPSGRTLTPYPWRKRTKPPLIAARLTG